ncbi:MAG: M1 family aminopeptidase [Bacteroidota bacterium]
MNNRLVSFICVLMFIINCSYAQTGVSLELAKERKVLISKIAYDIQLNIPGYPAQPIDASEKISFVLGNIGSDLLLDFKEETDKLRSLIVNDQDVTIIHKDEHIIIHEKYLIKGLNKISIKFIAGDKALNRKPEFMYSLLVPEKARTFFPCFDQPDLKAQFTLTTSVPLGWEAISNGSIKDTLVSEHRKTFSFNTSDTISTYLFSIVAGKFRKATQYFDNKEVNFYFRETDTAKIKLSIDTIFELHKTALKFLEKYTEVPYPFKKFDFIAIPDFQYGGMEHVGAIDYPVSSLFLDSTAILDQKMDRARVIGHETAHMWFGNLVTMKWFNDVWMKEVFANFISDKMVGTIFPDNNFDFQFLLENHPSAYYVDRTKGTHPIRQELNNLDQAGLLYGAIIYNKAPIVMKQLEKTVGEENFRKGVSNYIKQFSFQNADWSDLITILKKQTSKNLDEWNANWVNKGGRPVISFKIDSVNNIITSFTITQKGENNIKGIWEQSFTVAFIYKDTVMMLPVQMEGKEMNLSASIGLQVPMFIVLNASGNGYGSFPVDKNMIGKLSSLREPLIRASALLNLYEKVIDGEAMKPVDFLKTYIKQFNKENDELILDRMRRQFVNIYWKYISLNDRKKLSFEMESAIWYGIKNASIKQKKQILFQLYTSIALSNDATNKLYKIWKSKKGPYGVSLAENDLVSLSRELAVRKHPDTKNILNTQLVNIKDKDRKERFKYLLSALSNNTSVRDSFFSSLLLKKNRVNEDWVIAALRYLHHPLRVAISEKYLSQTLELLKELQSTGGIFFATDWLGASFGYCQSPRAASIVKLFLQKHADYDVNLKRKILQVTDDLMRTQKILK